MTAIQLPLSFFTSYFGQNVSEITGDNGNPSSWDLWKVGSESINVWDLTIVNAFVAPITVVIIVVALLIASHIMYPQSKLWFWKWKPRPSKPGQGARGDTELRPRY